MPKSPIIAQFLFQEKYRSRAHAVRRIPKAEFEVQALTAHDMMGIQHVRISNNDREDSPEVEIGGEGLK